MAYDEALADRVRQALTGVDGLAEQRMFGGLCFTVNGHMVCGIAGDRFMARVGPEQYEAALAQPHVRPMDFTGRPMRGLVYVDPQGGESVEALRPWVEKALAFAETIPPKRSKSASKQRRGAKA